MGSIRTMAAYGNKKEVSLSLRKEHCLGRPILLEPAMEQDGLCPTSYGKTNHQL